MNNLTLTLHSQEPELGEIISDASSNPIIKVEMEPYYAPVPVWMASLEFNGRTYRLYAREVVDEEPETLDKDKPFPNWHPFETDVPKKKVEYRCGCVVCMECMGRKDKMNQGSHTYGTIDHVEPEEKVEYRCIYQGMCGRYRGERIK